MTLPEAFDLIRGLEERLLDPLVRLSPQAVAALLSDDFLEFGRSGAAYRKEDVISGLATESSESSSELAASGYELRALAADVFLLTYRTMRKRKDGAELHSLRSSIWKLIDFRWQMVFHQGTPTSPTA